MVVMIKYVCNCFVECFNIGDFCYYIFFMVEGFNLLVKVFLVVFDDYELFC